MSYRRTALALAAFLLAGPMNVSAICGETCYPILPGNANSCNVLESSIAKGITLCKNLVIGGGGSKYKQGLCTVCIESNCGSDPFSAALTITCATVLSTMQELDEHDAEDAIDPTLFDYLSLTEGPKSVGASA
ncbi:hypothetical protein LTR17_027450 [Elasticomyces elasticus]|nr:hypothetical protein LTR17_027450 [Elasticomyces elasticus]